MSVSCSFSDFDENVRKNVITHLNDKLGDSITNLNICKALLTELQQSKTEVENKLQFASSVAPSQITEAIEASSTALEKCHQLGDDETQAETMVGSVVSATQPMVEELTPLISGIEKASQYHIYLQWLRTVESTSNEIETALKLGTKQVAITQFVKLSELGSAVEPSSCRNLVTFIKDTLLFWHRILKQRLTEDFEETLKVIKWPFISSNMNVHQSAPPGDIMTKFETTLQYLLQLKLPLHLEPRPSVVSALLGDFPPLSLPVQLLVRPLRKRFIFHFYGKKQTNNPEKPEWYLSQVLRWIHDHNQFITRWVQPVVNRSDSVFCARIEFMAGLVHTLMEKLNHDLPDVEYDDALFSHTVDEILSFDRELRTVLGYPSSLPSVLSIITQAQFFTRWTHIESKYAVERMDSILASETAWSTQSGEDIKVTECAEAFLTLLLTMTDRYKWLPQPGHRLQFVDLQLLLLDDLRVRLLQVLRDEKQDPLGSRCPSLVNTVHYISTVLKEWRDLPFFLQMQYYKLQYESLHQLTDAPPPTSDEILDSLTGTVFDETIALYGRIETDMVEVFTECIVMEFKAKSRPYRKDKWFSMPPAKDYIGLSVSPSACPMLQVLTSSLHALRDSLSLPVFDQIWQLTAGQLNQYLFEELVLQNNFNEGGAAQLQFDMTRNLFPMFGDFTQRPENFFKDLKEACTLLNLAGGSARLIRDTLHACANQSPAEEVIDAEAVLAEVGIFKLSPHTAESVLILRTELSVS